MRAVKPVGFKTGYAKYSVLDHLLIFECIPRDSVKLNYTGDLYVIVLSQ